MKMIKFDLRLQDVKVTNLEELQENFCADILPIFQTGRLAKWFKSRDLSELAQAIDAIDKNSSELEQLAAICRVLELDDDSEVLQFLLEDRFSRQTVVQSVVEDIEESEVAEGEAMLAPVSLDWNGQDMSKRYFGHDDFRCANFQGTNFSYSDFTGSNLSGANLTQAKIRKTNFSGANLTGAKLDSCTTDHLGVSRTDFSGADLSNATLTHSKLGYADFSGANLSNATLTHSNLDNADFSGANLSNADLSFSDLGYVKWDEKTILTGTRLTGVTNFEDPRRGGKDLNEFIRTMGVRAVSAE